MAVRGVARNLGLVGDFGERIDGFFGCGVKCTYDLGFDLDSGCVASFMRWPLVIFLLLRIRGELSQHGDGRCGRLPNGALRLSRVCRRE